MVSVSRVFLFFLVLRRGCVILSWHPLGLPYNYVELHTVSYQMHVYIQSESCITSCIQIIIAAMKNKQSAKTPTSSFNYLGCGRQGYFSAIGYLYLFGFCSEGFPLPSGAWSRLCYFIVALPIAQTFPCKILQYFTYVKLVISR